MRLEKWNALAAADANCTIAKNKDASASQMDRESQPLISSLCARRGIESQAATSPSNQARMYARVSQQQQQHADSTQLNWPPRAIDYLLIQRHGLPQ
jgi:hypothetical protein